MKSRTVIGIDGGATSTRAVVLDDRESELGRGQAGPALTDGNGGTIEIDALAMAAERAAEQAGLTLPVAALCAGLAGVGREEERATVEAALGTRGIASTSRVVTDAEAAFYDAFAAGPGILVLSGTGSIAWGRAEDGREARAGGWGSLIGDEGSGYDIGLRGLRAAQRAADGRGSETELLARLNTQLGAGGPEDLVIWTASAAKSEIAGLALPVCDLARAGDAVAATIVDVAVASLTSHVAALLARLAPWNEPPGLALGGGLLYPGGPLRDSLVVATADYPCVPVAAEVDAARGAALIALRIIRQTS
jgi:glucosamine kinase